MSDSSVGRSCRDLYSNILSRIKCDPFIEELASGRVKMPLFTYEAPFDPNYGFPPALIPVLSTPSWPGYIGLVHHWFGNAADTFVKYYAEQSLMVEIANDINQLRVWLVFEFLSNVPEVDEVAQFATAVGFTSMSEVEGYFSRCERVGDLANLGVFSNAPAALRSRDGRPNWVCAEDSFDRHFESGDFELAWYALNSRGLDFHSTAGRLEKLISHAKSPDFVHLVQAWKLCNEF